MPTPDREKIRTFASSRELHRWLKEHHASESQLWIKVFKKHTNRASIDWDEIVLETLCWGWIDGVKKSFDEQSYLQRITPRRAKSNWSKRNTEHAEQLIGEGRMQEAGLVQIRAAQADGRWERAYPPVSQMKVPQDFLSALESNPKAKKFFETLNKSSRYVIAYGLTSAKRAETRTRRFEKFMSMLVRQEKPGFGTKK